MDGNGIVNYRSHAMQVNMALKAYLIQLVISRFSLQYKIPLKIRDFDAFTIPPRAGSVVGYEIYSKKFKDHFRVRLYCKVGDYTDITPIVLEEDVSNVGINGDEVYVAYATLDNSFLFIDNNEVRQDFNQFDFDPTLLRIILSENDLGIQTENGFYILQEDAE